MNKLSGFNSATKSKIDFSAIVLESQFDGVFDSITTLVSKQLDAPVALITFVDENSIWIHSEVGFPNIKVVPNKKRFCGIFPKDEHFFELVDTDLDEEHSEHAFHIEGIKAKYYAGAKINLPLGEMIGVLCIFDINQRLLSSKQRDLLIDLACVLEKILITKSFHKRIN